MRIVVRLFNGDKTLIDFERGGIPIRLDATIYPTEITLCEEGTEKDKDFWWIVLFFSSTLEMYLRHGEKELWWQWFRASSKCFRRGVKPIE